MNAFIVKKSVIFFIHANVMPLSVKWNSVYTIYLLEFNGLIIVILDDAIIEEYLGSNASEVDELSEENTTSMLSEGMFKT